MATESLRDIPSDDEISVDENDPDLLGELNEITGQTLETIGIIIIKGCQIFAEKNVNLST